MKTILVIDDNELVRQSVAAYLAARLKNSRVLTASNGLEGEQVLGAHPVDLILTDIDMPVMDGITFIQQSKKLSSGIPIFVMSGERLTEKKATLAEMGVSRFFEKPFPFEELIREVAEALCMTLPVNLTNQTETLRRTQHA